MKKLTRSKINRKIFGVCGGFGEYFDVDTTVIRLITLVMGVFFPPMILIYFLSAIIIPQE